jgi:polysaccharide biosynthesis/export protein
LTLAELEATGLEMKAMEVDLRRDGLSVQANLMREIGEDIKTQGRISSDDIRVLRDELLKVGRAGMANRLKDSENRTKVSCDLPLMDNLRVKDVILMAGGLTNVSYLERGEIIRSNKKKEYTTHYFNVAKAMEGDSDNNLELRDEDRIVIHSIWEQVYKKNVVIEGEVAKPGSYQFTEGMTVRDLVFKGGNILESAYVDEAEISSISTEGRMASKTERKVISLRKALGGDRENNLFLKPNDHLFVKRIPDWGSMKFVTVGGEFRFPGRYTIRKGEKLASLIERAGGYTDNAYLRGAVFKRETVREIQQRSLDEMAQRLQRELLSSASASVAVAVSSEEVQAKRAEAEMKQRLIEYMKSLRATGRMTIAVTNLRMLKGSTYDIELEEGDSLYLPQKNSVVNIVGAVMSEGSHIYNENWGYEDYIGVAGG